MCELCKMMDKFGLLDKMRIILSRETPELKVRYDQEPGFHHNDGVDGDSGIYYYVFPSILLDEDISHCWRLMGGDPEACENGCLLYNKIKIRRLNSRVLVTQEWKVNQEES